MLERPHKGVFWLIDGKIWKSIKPWKCHYPYNYYPRGRAEITSKNLCILYMNPNIGEEYIDEIMKKFGLVSVSKINYDKIIFGYWMESR